MSETPRSSEVAALERRLYRERKARHEAEEIAERATRQLYEALANVNRRVDEQTRELRELNQELEQRVVERTLQLELARKAAEAANRTKSEFLANMSHEIRTPLNAVIGLTEVLLRTDLSVSQREHLRTVMDAGESLLAVINDILDLSKVEAGKLHLERIEFDLHDTVGDALRPLALRAQLKGVELAYFIDPAVPPRIIGDPGRVRQVITNLVGNAIKFTERGEVVVRVERESSEATSVVLHYSVRDTGIGIEPQQLDRLFESFVQVDSSTTRRHGGTGLGLSISRQLVELMGGQIGAKSAVGQGSIFSFTAGFGVPDRIRAWERPTSLPLEGTRVLIVDDNASNRLILEEVTRAMGMQPVLAASAGAGFAELERAADAGPRIPLLLTDMQMPERDGFSLIERLRGDVRFDGLEIIAMTPIGDSKDGARCESLRVAERLTKPVKQSELFEAMARVLGVALPLTPEAASPDPRADRGERLDPSERTEIRLEPRRILLVEDSAANQKVALAMLAEHGHRVALARNGREAVERLGSEDFDLVLMDVQMPEMDGLAATTAIRAAEAGTPRHVPIIAMTAHALRGDREKCLAAGMDDYISKPVRRVELFRALARQIRPGPP